MNQYAISPSDPSLPAEYVDESQIPHSDDQMFPPSFDVINEDEEPVQQRELVQQR